MKRIRTEYEARGIVYIADGDGGVGRIRHRTRYYSNPGIAEAAARDLARRHGIVIDGTYNCVGSEFWAEPKAMKK